MKYLWLILFLFSFQSNGFAVKDSLVFYDDFLLNRALLSQKVDENLDQQVQDISMSNVPQKSIPLAVGMSAVVPGAGQFYAKSYIKAGIFLAVEVGAWAANIHYNNEGDKKDAEFHTFADQNWSEYRYWSYVNYLNSQLADPLIQVYPFYEEMSSYGGTWYLINENIYNQDVIEDLRTIEDDFPNHTHRLPATKTQQYYEMIGKYPGQFGNAWADATFNARYSGFEGRITPLNDNYSQMRAEANSLYDKAGYGAMVVLVNHIIAAIDAGFTTRSYNRRQMRMSYQSRAINGEFVNMFGLDFTW
jgi:hypothetical protein